MAADLSAVVPFGVEGTPGHPTLRWAGRATSVAGIERELGRIWASPGAAAGGSNGERVGRTSVLNLVVVARSAELGELAAATLAAGTGRHPSRTLILLPTDPDGPGWLRADVRAWCMVPRPGAPETCAEQVYVTAGGETGRHLDTIVAPLLVHDLPVTVWLPGDPPFASEAVAALVAAADRLVLDSSRWGGDGLDRLAALAGLARPTLPISDFAFMRQARWREAVASAFDRPAFLPYLRALRRIDVAYATHGGPNADDATNLVKPLYHVAWLASRLGLEVRAPLERAGRRAEAGRRLRAVLTTGGGKGTGPEAEVEVVLRPLVSPVPAGTTLRVELVAERRGSRLQAVFTAEAERVDIRLRESGKAALDRAVLAGRRTDADLLTEAIEAGGRDLVAEGSLAMAARLARSGAGARAEAGA